MDQPRTCRRCCRPIQRTNRTGACSRCRTAFVCNICCDPIVPGRDGSQCRACKVTVTRIGRIHAADAQMPKVPGHEERIARYAELARRGEPLRAA